MQDSLTVLLVEDDAALRMASNQALQLAGIEAKGFELAEHARDAIYPEFPGVIVTDVRLPGMDGLALLQHALETDPKLPVILITGHGDISMAVEAMRTGAYDFIEKPFPPERLVDAVQRALERRFLTLEVETLRRRLSDREGIDAILLGQSAAIKEVQRLILQVSDTSADVLIFGETGTGKELVARAIHQLSTRTAHAFVKLNCAAIPTGLLESELFGHEKGAFTGAINQRIGRFELANRGTVFLDEVGEIPLELQPKLLRVIQEREFERLGSTRTLRTDARLIAATNRDLGELADEQKFRQDLFYRLNVFPITVPPLRDRREDIPMLVRHFAQQFARRMKKNFENIPAETMDTLTRYDWPGNIRELQNLIERAVILSKGPTLDVPVEALNSRRESAASSAASGPAASTSSQGRSAQLEPGTLEDVDRRHIIAALERTNWVIAGPNGAAARLGVKRSTLQFRMRKLGITRPSPQH
jgi:two-component system, NtrC family, C4-dicarboxylate transport response regulator DctD